MEGIGDLEARDLEAPMALEVLMDITAVTDTRALATG
jgi:hypothetical protein